MKPGGDARPQYDERYKRLFASPRMVEDLLRAFVSGDELDAGNFSTLEKLSAEFVSDELLKRHGDTVWRLEVGGGTAYLLVLLEFQARDDRYMALRILSYTSLLYQELVRNKALDKQGRLPAVVPVVLYNGSPPWQAPREVGRLIAPVGKRLAPYQPSQQYVVVDEQHVGEDAVPVGNLMRAVLGLEQSRTPADLARVSSALTEWLAGKENAELRRVFLDWLQSLMEQVTPAGEELPAMASLEEVTMTTEERLREWPKQFLREGREQGLEQGIEQGIKQGIEQGIKRGREEGIEQGIERGREQERGLLCRMAAHRFGAETGERLAALLADADADRLAEAGDWLVRCEAGAEFLARVEAISRA